MATKVYNSGNKVEVFLKKSDFDKVGEDVTHNYTDGRDCPLARAIKRTFKANDVLVHGWDCGANINGEHWTNTDEWCHDIAENVGKRIFAGDKTRYFVTLTKE